MAEEGGRRSEQEEVDDFDGLEGATEAILHKAFVFGEGFVVTA